MSFKNFSRYLLTLFIICGTIIFPTLHCNAEGYSKVSFMRVRLHYAKSYSEYQAGVDYKEQTIMLNFKEDGSPAVIDLTSGGFNDIRMASNNVNYVGGEYYVGSCSENNLIQNVFKDCLEDNMDDYISLNCKKDKIQILPKSIEAWNAVEERLGLTEDNYRSKYINIYIKNKEYYLKPNTVKELNNPNILTSTRKSEKLYSTDTVYDISSLYSVFKGISYYHTLRKEEYSTYEILPNSKLCLRWNKYNEKNNTDSAKYVDKPVDILQYVSSAFYCPAYTVDALYVKNESGNYEHLSIDDTYNSNKEIYPHWVRKKGKSSLQVFSSQNIKDIERSMVVRVSDDKIEEVGSFLTNILDNEISDSETLLQVVDSTSDIYSKVSNSALRSKLYNNNIIVKYYLENKANAKGELYDLDDVFAAIDDMIDNLEEIMELPKYDENATAHRYYPNVVGTNNLYEIEFDTSEGVEFGKDIPLLDMSLSSWYKFAGWKVYEWSDAECKFIESDIYTELVNPNTLDEDNDVYDSFLSSDHDSDYYLVADWQEAKQIRFDLEGKIIGENDEHNGKIISGKTDVMYVLPNEVVDIDNPIREGYDFQGWYVKRYSNDKEGVFLQPLEDDDYSVKDIQTIGNSYGKTDTYYLVASWKRIYNSDKDNQSDEENKNENESKPDDLQEASSNSKTDNSNKKHKVTLKDTYTSNLTKVTVTNGKKWSDYNKVTKYAVKKYAKQTGWYNRTTHKKINNNDVIDLTSDIELYSIYEPTGKETITITFPQFNNQQVVCGLGTTIENNTFPNTYRDGDTFLGWTSYKPPFRDKNCVEYYGYSVILKDFPAELYAVYSSDIEEFRPETNQTLSMQRIYRNGRYKSPQIVINNDLKDLSITEYNSHVEDNADKLFQAVIDKCKTTEKKYLIITPDYMSQPNSIVLNSCDYLNSDLDVDDYIDALAFMHYKYFDVLDLLYTNSINAKNEQELKQYSHMNNNYFLQVKDFDYKLHKYQDENYDSKNAVYYLIDAKKFVDYYDYCQQVELKLDSLIKEFNFNTNTCITDAIDTLNVYLVKYMNYDNWYEIYDLYWFLVETSSDRESMPRKNVSYHGVCQSYTKFVTAIMGKCGYETNYYSGHDSKGVSTHCFNSFIINNQLYFCDFTWSDKNDIFEDMYLTEEDMNEENRLNPVKREEIFGTVIVKTDKQENGVKKEKTQISSTSIKKIKQNKNKVTITCKKVGSGTYTIMYSTDKHFKDFKELKNNKNKFVLKNLNEKQKYYFRVRFSKTVSNKVFGTTIRYNRYGKWSKVVTKKIKKYKKNKKTKKKEKK